MKPKFSTDTDVQLVALMVAKILKAEHLVEDAPALEDYEILEEEIRSNGSTNIRVTKRLGRGISIDVCEHWWNKRDLENLTEAAVEIADNLSSVNDRRSDILAMTKEVRSAVAREIAKAKRRGLFYRLVSANPATMYDNVRDGVTVDVVFERLSENLRPERALFAAAYTAEVVDAFESNREVQEERMMRRLHLDAVGATGRIDSVVVAALKEAGHDMADVLKQLATTDDWIVDIGQRGDDERKMFRLHWNKGDVYAQVTLGDGASWHEGRLSFREAPVSLARAKGKRVRDILDNPILGDIRATSGSGNKGEFVSLNCTPHLLNFDAETGRLWAA